MILRSSSLARPVLTSASTPRWRKMSTAAGLSLSAMSTRGIWVLRKPSFEGKGLGWDVDSGSGEPRSAPTARRFRLTVPRHHSAPVAGAWLWSGGGEFGADGGEGPVEPGRERLKVGGV